MRNALLYAAVSAGMGIISSSAAEAAVLYTGVGSTYSQNFNSLPTTPTDTNIEAAAFTDGWQDDVDPAVSSQNDVSIPGWYLWHSVSPTSENGVNGNQRFRIGAGGSNTGAFWSYGASANADRALGALGSTTIANQPTGTPPANDTRVLIALRLTNSTGSDLNEFTLEYDGEQWRDGGAATPAAETMLFDYSLDATAPQTGTFTAVSSLNYNSAVNANTGGGAAVDGNVAGLVDVGPVTVTLASPWLVGTDLWLRWNDPQRLGNDNGMAIDNVSFSAAVPEPTSLACIAIGLLGLTRRRRVR